MTLERAHKLEVLSMVNPVGDLFEVYDKMNLLKTVYVTTNGSKWLALPQ